MATKKTAFELATEMFDKGYATGAWYKKFSKATAAETKPKKTKKPKKIVKPKPQSRKSTDWNDIVDFIEKKYGKDVRNWAGRKTPPYQDFWHFIVDKCDVHNGSTIWLFPGDWVEDKDCPPWRKEICEILVKEFGSDFEVFVSW